MSLLQHPWHCLDKQLCIKAFPVFDTILSANFGHILLFLWLKRCWMVPQCCQMSKMKS